MTPKFCKECADINGNMCLVHNRKAFEAFEMCGYRQSLPATGKKRGRPKKAATINPDFEPNNWTVKKDVEEAPAVTAPEVNEPVIIEEIEEVSEVVEEVIAVAEKTEEVADFKVYDPVNKPSHYTQGSTETIDIIKLMLTPEEYRGFLKGNVIKYMARCEHKGNPAQDIEKSVWYSNRLKGELSYGSR